MSFPNGAKDKLISLKCCFAKGRPMMVMASKIPKMRCVSAIQIPPKNIQIMLKTVDKQPLSPGTSRTSRPNGMSVNMPILKHWIPNGIPMIVAQRINPARKYSTATKRPPKISQMIFPIRFIGCHKIS